MSRLTFPHIATEHHSLTTGLQVGQTILWPEKEANDIDKQLAREIIEIHQKIRGQAAASGEWRWIHQNMKGPYAQILEDGDSNALAHVLANFFRHAAVYGLISSDASKLTSLSQRTDLENNIYLDLDTWREFAGQDDKNISFLDTPRVGNPYGLLLGDTLISVDNPRHDYFALKLKKLTDVLKKKGRDNLKMIEIGGGYGGLGAQLTRRAVDCMYIDCDLPESLYLTYYFLRRATAQKIVWAIDAWPSESADVVLVPASSKSLIPGSVDIVFNSNSLSEMGEETVREYFSFFEKWQPHFFLHQNSNFLLFPNSVRHIEVLAENFPIDLSKYREVYRAISPWQGAGGRYREFLYERS